MLNFILGTAGSGKTWYTRNLISQLVSDGKRGIVLLVPEQNNYESERSMLRLLGSAASDVVEVSSFTLLARNVAALCGTDATRQADDGVKQLIMGRAVRSVKNDLKLYGRVAMNKDFCKAIIDLHTELKRASVSSDKLLSVCSQLDGAISDKMSDLALIINTYEGMLSQRFSDPLNMLDRLEIDLQTVDYFKDRTVFIDAFKDFTEQQYAVISRILSQAKDVYVTICADKLEDQDDGVGLFSNNKATADRLYNIARSAKVGIAKPIIVNNDYRFNGTSIRAVEQLLRGESPEPTQGGQITICSCSIMYEESDYIARTVRRLVRTENMRYRDFAVIARDINEYQNALVDAFGHYNIPCFSDMRVDASSLTLFRFVLNALACSKSSIRNDNMLSFIKSPLSPLSIEEASELENYVLMWDKNGSKWLEEWTENPNGLEEDIDSKALERINNARKIVTEPILELKQKLSSGNIRAVCRAIYDLLVKVGADKTLAAIAKEHDSVGEFYLADVHRRSWDVLMASLDDAVRVFEDDNCDADEFYDMLEVLLNSGDIGAIPDRIDEVIIGSADRFRAGNPKVTFIIGANYTEFPKPTGKTGLLVPAERRRLNKCGIPVPDYEIKAAVDEQFYVYSALCSPSERLYITYHTSSVSGGQSVPSEFVRRISKGIDGVVTTNYSVSLIDRFEGVMPAVELVSSEQYSCYSDSLISQLSDRDIKAPDINSKLGVKPVSLSKENAIALFGSDIKMSASKAEVYAKCPFSFFCEFGVKARPLTTAKLDVMRRGTLVHYVLEKTVETHGKGLASLSPEQRREEISALLQEYANKTLGGYDSLDKTFLFMLERIALLIDFIVAHLGKEFEVCDFEPDCCELQIGSDDLPALTVELEEGSLVLTGLVDRLDVYEADGRKYVRVVDYKTGSKVFDLSDVFYGMNMQMLIYLFAVIGSNAYQDALPAGVLYMPSKRPIHTAKDSSEAEAASNKDLRMNGLLVDDEISLAAMEHDLSGKFIPYNSNGKIKNAIDADSFNKLKAIVIEMLKKAGDGIHSGRMDIMPTDAVDADACKYCEYKSVCLITEDQPHCQVEELSLIDAITKLNGGEIDG